MLNRHASLPQEVALGFVGLLFLRDLGSVRLLGPQVHQVGIT
jgi:hypothetical protein